MKNTQDIENMIVRAHRAGVCDIDGNSVTINGKPTKPPTTTSSATQTYRWDSESGKLYEVHYGE